MKIYLKNKYGLTLVIETDNVKIEKDIEKRKYEKDSSGGMIFKSKDVDTNYIILFDSVLQDILQYRKDEYDGSDLIKELVRIMPQDKYSVLINELKNTYEEV